MKYLKLLLITLLVANFSTGHSYAQVLKGDTLRTDSAEKILEIPDTVPHLQSNFASFVPPAVFAGYGLLSLGVKPLRNLDRSVYRDMQKDHPNFHTKIDNYLQYVPVVTVYALNISGIPGKNRFIDRTILYAMSEGIRAGVVSVIKHSANRTRPNGADRLSFPSGHSSTAFAAAEFMSQEYGEVSPWFGVYAYSFATATAILRVYNNNHWLSDIIAGAGFGILSTKAAYLIYPYVRNKLFSKSKNDKKTSVLMPSFGQGYAGFTFVKAM